MYISLNQKPYAAAKMPVSCLASNLPIFRSRRAVNAHPGSTKLWMPQEKCMEELSSELMLQISRPLIGPFLSLTKRV